MSAAPLDFGRHPLGSYSWQSFVVNNTGAVSLTIAAVTLTDGAARLHHHQRHVLVAGRRAGGIVRRSTALHTHTDRCRERRATGAS